MTTVKTTMKMGLNYVFDANRNTIIIVYMSHDIIILCNVKDGDIVRFIVYRRLQTHENELLSRRKSMSVIYVKDILEMRS